MGADGAVVRPTSSGPEAAAAADAAARAAVAATDAAVLAGAAGAGADGHEAQLAALVGDEEAAAASAWVAAVAAAGPRGDPPTPPPLTLPAPDAKAGRAGVHAWFRGAAAAAGVAGGVDTATAARDDGAVDIVATAAPPRARKRARDASNLSGKRDDRNAVAATFPGGRERRFCHFTLSKVGWDTAAALAALARAANAPASSFAVAGTKDRRAATTQRASAWGVAAGRLAAAADRVPRVAVGDFSYHSSPVRLGDAAGNEFVVVLRRVQAEGAGAVAGRAACLAENGFLNFFGRQRFGARASAPTHEVGAALARGDLKGAIDMILSAEGGGGGASPAARALRAALARAPADHAGALARLPRTLRAMYTHALQSRLWNAMATARAGLSGVGEGGEERREVSGSAPHTSALSSLASVLPGDVILETDDEADDSESDDGPRRAPRVRVATAADARTVSVSRLVLPLAAPNAVYPTNGPRDAAAALAGGMGIDLASCTPTAAGAKPPPVALGCLAAAAGGYRKLLVRPSHVGVDLVTVADADDAVAGDGCLTAAATPWTPGAPVPPGAAVAVVVRFRLPKSAYATVAVRELTRGGVVEGDGGGGGGGGAVGAPAAAPPAPPAAAGAE